MEWIDHLLAKIRPATISVNNKSFIDPLYKEVKASPHIDVLLVDETMEGPLSTKEQVKQWMSQQSDLIECPLGATMRLATCQNRQKKLPAYMSQDNDDIGPSSYFGRCAILGCQHYNPPPKKKGKSLEETRRGYRAEYTGGKTH